MQIALWADLGLWNEGLQKMVSQPTCLQITVEGADRKPSEFIPSPQSASTPCTRLLVGTSHNFAQDRKQIQIVNADPLADFFVGNTKAGSKLVPQRIFCVELHPTKAMIPAPCKAGSAAGAENQFINPAALPDLFVKILEQREKKLVSEKSFTPATTGLRDLSGTVDCLSLGAISTLSFTPSGSHCAFAVNVRRSPKVFLPWKGSLTISITSWHAYKIPDPLAEGFDIECDFSVEAAVRRGKNIKYMVNEQKMTDAKPIGTLIAKEKGKPDEIKLDYEGLGPFTKVVVQNTGTDPWCIGDILIDGEEPGKKFAIDQKPSKDGMLKKQNQQMIITGQRWRQELANVAADCLKGDYKNHVLPGSN